ncbi:hypothetical protein Tco_0525390 [Tanacetum coccineum]
MYKKRGAGGSGTRLLLNPKRTLWVLLKTTRTLWCGGCGGGQRGGEDGEGSGGWWSLKVVAVVLAAAGVAVEGDGDVNGGVSDVGYGVDGVRGRGGWRKWRLVVGWPESGRAAIVTDNMLQ